MTQEAFIFTKEDGRIHHKKIDIKKSDSLKEELKDFIDSVRSGNRPTVSGEDGRRALEVALRVSDEIHKSQNGLVI